MTNYKLECEQPTVKCRFILKCVEEFELYIDLTIPELDQVQKGNVGLSDLWDKKYPDGDKESYIDTEAVSKLEVENKNPDIDKKWLPLNIKQ